MPTNTDNHNLQKFSDGETPWSHNPDMETLEVAVSVKRARAPDTSQDTPHDGAVFLDTSTGDIYVADGSSWGTPRWSLGDIGSGGDSTADVSNTDIDPASVVQHDTQAPIQGAIIEGFEAGDLSHYSGSVNPYSIVASEISGQNMLRFDAPTGTSSATSFHMPSNVTTTQRGMSYSAYVRGTDNGTGGVDAGQFGFGILTDFASGSISSGFVIRANFGDNDLEVLEYDNGFVGGYSQNVTLSNNTLYRLEIDAEAGSDRVIGRIFDSDDTLLGTVPVTPSSSTGNQSGGFAWYSRVTGEGQWGVYDLLHQQPLNSTPNRMAVASPDVHRIFVRSTDPANEYDINDNTDFWIDTS